MHYANKTAGRGCLLNYEHLNDACITNTSKLQKYRGLRSCSLCWKWRGYIISQQMNMCFPFGYSKLLLWRLMTSAPMKIPFSWYIS